VLPRPLAGFKDPTSKGREGRRRRGRGGGAIEFLASRCHRLSYATAH